MRIFASPVQFCTQEFEVAEYYKPSVQSSPCTHRKEFLVNIC